MRGARATAQGVASSNAQPVRSVKASGLPWDAQFTDAAAEAGIDLRFTYGGEDSKSYIIEANGSGAAFLDYDGDGRLDIFLANGSKLEGFSSGPAPTNRLYRNLGGGRFADVSAAAGIAARKGRGMSAAFADYDDDGFLDVFVTNDNLPNFLFRNDGGGAFEEDALLGGAALLDHGKPVASMGADFRDYDNDGRPDIHVTALSG